MPAVITIGDALVDVIDDVPLPGGAALNVACGLATLGCESLLVTQLGDDAHGTILRDHLRQFGVGAIATESPLGTAAAIATVGEDGTEYRFNEAARARRFVVEGDATLAVEAADLVVVSSFPFQDADQVDALLAAVPDSRARLVVDPNPRPGYLDGPDDVRAFADNLRRVAARSVLVKLSDEDATLLYDRKVDPLAEEFLAAGTAVVVTTHGAKGATLHRTGQRPVDSPAVPLPGPVVDTIGAGDAVLAAVVDGMLRHGGDWPTIMMRAMRIASATVRGAGGRLRLPEGD